MAPIPPIRTGRHQPSTINRVTNKGEFKVNKLKRHSISSLSLIILALVATLVRPIGVKAQGDPAQSAYQVYLDSTDCFSGTSKCSLILVIPSGKRFVLERLTGKLCSPTK